MKKWNQQYHDKFKAFALIHKVWDQKNLEKAWKRVKANKGSAGIDRITIEQFEQNLQQNLAEIQRLLKEKRYEPSPVLRAVSYTHLRAHETRHDLVCRLLLEKKKTKIKIT